MVEYPPGSGDKLWFNIAHHGRQGFATYGDGSEIEEECVDAVTAAHAKAMRVLKLGAGEVPVLDNWRWLHGRIPYAGPREVVTLLTAD